MKKYDAEKPLRILVVPDKFKGCLSAHEVGQTISAAILNRTHNWEVEIVPVADGGDGSLSILLRNGFRPISIPCQGALGETKVRQIGLSQKHAFIELAEICGIGLLNEEELQPFRASTFGLGQALLAAIYHGANEVTFSLGGSATIDGGFGFLCALGARGFDEDGNEVTKDLYGLMELDSIDLSGMPDIVRKIKVRTLVDVNNLLTGPNGATFIYGRQKGLKENELKHVDMALERWASILQRKTQTVLDLENGLGAAGGMPVALVNVFNSPLISGSAWFMEKLDIQKKIQGADLIITAEGKFDRQSMMGKITGEVIKSSQDAGKDCTVITGVIDDENFFLDSTDFISMSKLAGSSATSMENPQKWLTKATDLLFMK